MFGKILLNFGRARRIGEVIIPVAFFGGADGCEAFEKGARRVVETHGGLPGADLRHGARETNHRVVLAWDGSVAGGAVRDQCRRARNFFSGADRNVAWLAIAR